MGDAERGGKALGDGGVWLCPPPNIFSFFFLDWKEYAVCAESQRGKGGRFCPGGAHPGGFCPGRSLFWG